VLHCHILKILIALSHPLWIMVLGSKYKMPEVKLMVAQDPSMLERFSNAEK
jgi:hypothetical protein